MPIVFDCKGCRLIGIITSTQKQSTAAVLIVVGGPQYRAGSHRQFTLLARNLAENGIPSLRFDYRGMGDSEGDSRGFEELNDDLRSAVSALISSIDCVENVIIWGLCDAASATLYYAYTDIRVCGIILLNPWVHTEIGANSARLKHYYLTRFLQKAFWIKLSSGKVDIIDSLKQILSTIFKIVSNRLWHSKIMNAEATLSNDQTFISRMLDGLNQYSCRVLIILSGNDLVAQEFQQLVKTNRDWNKALSLAKVETSVIKEANHTFSSRIWRQKVNELTINWVSKNFILPIDKKI